MAKAIMIQGTASNVGKSVIATGLCRIFAHDGYRVAPFKAQNISDISYFTADGCEISKAQALQAQAAYREPDVRMNPILMKPRPGYRAQIILNGHPLEDVTPEGFYAMREHLKGEIARAYESLSAENDIMVIEGAGCSAEINLTQSDIVNMSVARMSRAPVLLVGDIDRGGVFAALYGTFMLQPPQDRVRIKGTIINRFKGDPRHLEPAPRQLEELLGIPTVGVVPYTRIDIEPEDVLAQGSEAVQNDFDGLAGHLRAHLDMKLIYEILERGLA